MRLVEASTRQTRRSTVYLENFTDGAISPLQATDAQAGSDCMLSTKACLKVAYYNDAGQLFKWLLVLHYWHTFDTERKNYLLQNEEKVLQGV